MSALPSAAEIRERLKRLRYGSLTRLADLSGVPHRTLVKIRAGETMNPGIDTVRAFEPYIEEAANAPVSAPAPLS